MAERFTGFWEDHETIATTIVPIALEDLLERLRARLEAAGPGVRIRIDLISWEDE